MGKNMTKLSKTFEIGLNWSKIIQNGPIWYIV